MSNVKWLVVSTLFVDKDFESFNGTRVQPAAPSAYIHIPEKIRRCSPRPYIIIATATKPQQTPGLPNQHDVHLLPAPRTRVLSPSQRERICEERVA